MANWIITDNGTLIQIEHEGLEVFNNPKSDTEIKIVRAKTGDNTSSVDKLYIGFDTSWPCQINWNDVTVDGVAPTDVDDFSDKVEVVLNNVSTGGGFADVDDASDVTKANITSGYRVWMQDPSTADNYDISAYDFINAVTLTSAQAITLLASPNSIIVDSKYKITSLGITGVTEVIISGRNMIQGNSPAEALVTALGVYVPCTYDVATNTLYCATKIRLFLTKSPDVGNPVTATIIESNYANSDLAFSVAYAGSETDWDLLITCTSATTLFSENDGNAILGMVFIDKNGEMATFGGLIVGNNAIQATGWSITNSVILATERVSNSVIEIIKIIQ